MRGLLLGCALTAFGCGLTLDLTPPVTDGGGGTPDGGFLDAAVDAAVDAIPPDAPSCMTVDDCAGLVRMEPPTTCGDYRCESGRCLANDLDGDGVGPGCEDEADCNDEDPAVSVARPESCNGIDDDCNGIPDDGLVRVVGEGSCERRYGCMDGAWSTNPPTTSMEICGDTIDDDCDGTADDPECHVTDCILVSSNPEISGVRSIGEAIFTTLGDPARYICLIANTEDDTCRPTDFPLRADVPAGTTIIGNLRVDAGGALAPCSEEHSTRIIGTDITRPVTVAARQPGVVQLINLAVHYINRPDPTAVVVSTGRLVLSNVLIASPDVGFVSGRSIGIRVEPGSELIAHETNIQPFAESSVGIESTQSAVTVLAGCDGDCDCAPAGGVGIHGRGNEGAGVLIDRGTLVVDRHALCGNGAPALVLENAGAFVASSSLITRFAPDAVTVECRAPTPGVWLHDNEVAVRDVEGDDATALSIVGQCSALLSANSIQGQSGGTSDTTVGVYCDGAECLLDSNTVLGAEGVSTASSVFGVVCKSDSGAGSCRVLTRNTIVAGTMGTIASLAMGLEIHDSSLTYFEGNHITGGCGENATGVYADQSTIIGRANVLTGSVCTNAGVGSNVGLEASGSNLSLLGNTMLGGGGGVAGGDDCESFGAIFSSSPAILRNNLFLAGPCPIRIAADVDGDESLLLHNGFSLADVPLYYDGNEYYDAGTLIADHPLFVGHVFDDSVGEASFVGYPTNLQLTPSSPFAGTGSAPGGQDVEGNPRSDPPSIGAYEP